MQSSAKGQGRLAKQKARRGRRCAGLLKLTNNWEEEVLLVPRQTLGGGVRPPMIGLYSCSD
jgi:hypothetical protein